MIKIKGLTFHNNKLTKESQKKFIEAFNKKNLIEEKKEEELIIEEIKKEDVIVEEVKEVKKKAITKKVKNKKIEKVTE